MPEKIVWSDSYKIGVPKIDNQHRQLFDLLEALRLSLPRGLQNAAVGAALKALVDYTQTHFAEEELFMRQIKFERLEEHAKLHRDLVGEVVAILQRLKSDEDYSALDLIAFLKHWIVDHMIDEDTKIGIAYREVVSSATSL